MTGEVQMDPFLLEDAQDTCADRGGGADGHLAARRLLDARLRRLVHWPRARDYAELADDFAAEGRPEDALLLRRVATTDGLLAEAQTRWNARYDARPETRSDRDTQRIVDVGLIDLDPDGPHPGIDGSRYWPGYTNLETGHQAPVVVVISRGQRELVTGFDDQAAVARWLHDRGPMATGPLAPPDVPVLPRTVLEEHVLARLLYPHGDLPSGSTEAPATTFTADARYDIYAAITTLAGAGQLLDLERVSAELGRRADWIPEWALAGYTGRNADWAQTYLRRLAVTEPTTFTLQRLVADDTAARLANDNSRSALAAPPPHRHLRQAASPVSEEPSLVERPPDGPGLGGPTPQH